MILVTGVGGLVGFSVANLFLKKGYNVCGIENNYRRFFFGKDGDINFNLKILKKNKKFKNFIIDITNDSKIDRFFRKNNFSLIVHAAAQPSHDWSAKFPKIDFNVNARGTLNLLEASRKFNSKAKFIYLSTNKVYGDSVNDLKYEENKMRFTPPKKFKNGFNENLSIDNTKHSPFGASKLSGDLMVQEYGKYFKMKTVCLRAGCLTGEHHSGVELHGFLSYLFKCCFYKKKYFIYGYGGKQVRDNLSSSDVAEIIWNIFKNDISSSEIYNIGGGTESNISILEAIEKCQKITKNKMIFEFIKNNRSGDHKYWVTDMTKFKKKYKKWKIKNKIDDIIESMHNYELYKNNRKLFFTK